MRTRREFLKKLGFAGISSSFFLSLIDQIVYAQINEALELVKNDFKYLGLSMPGGPPRWFFDLPLYQNEEQKNSMIPNPMVFTKYLKNTTGDSALKTPNPDGVIKAIYELKQHHGVYLPEVWNSSFEFNEVKNSLSDLAKHCIFMRGMESLPFHSGYYKAFQPTSNIPSTAAITSIKNNKLAISSIQYAHHSVEFNHPLNITPIVFNDLPTNFDEVSQCATSIFAPLIIDQKEKDRLIDARIKRALDHLEKVDTSYSKNSKKLYQLSEKTRELMGRKVGNIIDEIIEAYASYVKVNELSMRTELAGIDDAPLFNPATSSEFKQESHQFDDNFNEIPTSNYFASNEKFSRDFRDILRSPEGARKKFNACCFDLCFSLSIAEVLFKNKITNSLLLTAGQLRGILNGQYKYKLRNDGHDIGASISHLFYSKYFQALGHSINHFTQQIGQTNFNNTLIHLTSEFSRSPRVDASGSDHGNTACTTTLISGMIKRPHVLGEIDYKMTNNIKDIYQGTWGQSSSGKNFSEVYAQIEELLEVDRKNRVSPNPPLKKEEL